MSRETRTYSGPKVLGELRTSSEETVQYYSMYTGEVPKMMSSDWLSLTKTGLLQKGRWKVRRSAVSWAINTLILK